MAEFKVTDFVHLGIDKGVEKAEWRISLNEENTQIIITETILGNQHVLKWNHNMKVMHNPFDATMDMETINGGIGIYWNGDTSIYVSVRITIGGILGEWHQKSWSPPRYTENNLWRRLANPLDLERIPNYFSHSPKTL